MFSLVQLFAKKLTFNLFWSRHQYNKILQQSWDWSWLILYGEKNWIYRNHQSYHSWFGKIVFLSVHLSLCLVVRSSIHLFVLLIFVHLSFYLYVCLAICLIVHLYLHVCCLFIVLLFVCLFCLSVQLRESSFVCVCSYVCLPNFIKKTCFYWKDGFLLKRRVFRQKKSD